MSDWSSDVCSSDLDRVLGVKIDRPAAIEAVVEAGAGEIPDRIVQIVHAHGDAGAGEIDDFLFDLLAVRAFPDHAQLARAGHAEIDGAILVPKGVTADHTRVGPTQTPPRYVLHDERYAEDKDQKRH